MNIVNRSYAREKDEILQPVLLHQWALDTTLPDDLNQLLRVQTLRCSINLVKKTFRLEVEQPVMKGNTMFHIIELLTRGSTGITIQAVTADGAYDMVGVSAVLVNHSYEQDYAGPSDVAKHILDFEF